MVQLNEIGTDREGTALECFYVAEQKENGWHLTEAFEGCKVTPWNLSRSTDYKEAAEKLSSWVTAKKLSAETRMTDADGKLVFEDLNEGIYLIRQKNGQKTYGVIAPFLVCKNLEEICQIIKFFFIRHGLIHDLKQIFVDFLAFAGYFFFLFCHKQSLFLIISFYRRFTKRVRIAFRTASTMTPTSAKIATHMFAIPTAPRIRQITLIPIAK